MKTFVGPKERLRFKEKVDAELKVIQNIFFVLMIALPIVVFSLFRYNFVQGPASLNEDQSSAVALLTAGGSTGTAFLFSENKLITAAHVVVHAEIGDEVLLKFYDDLNEYTGRVLYKPASDDDLKDYAIIEIEDKRFKTFLKLAKASDIAKLNDQVLVVGFPGGQTYSSASGEITNLNAMDKPEFLQLQAGAWPGNSGGPVIHKESGKVIGILSSGYENEFKGIILSLKTEVLLLDPNLRGVVNFE
jgi:S1-C subfamily serine protease